MSGAWRDDPAARRRLKALGRTVRRIRQQRGLSQEALALQMNLHRTHVSSIERGLTNPSLLGLYALADGLSVDIRELLAPDAH